MSTLPLQATDSFSRQAPGSRWLPPMDSVEHLWRAGPIALPGSGRVVWWTGRVAIGLRYDGPRLRAADREPSRWIAA